MNRNFEQRFKILVRDIHSVLKRVGYYSNLQDLLICILIVEQHDNPWKITKKIRLRYPANRYTQLPCS